MIQTEKYRRSVSDRTNEERERERERERKRSRQRKRGFERKL